MFTGLVQELGRFLGATRKGAGYELRVAAPFTADDVSVGDSIAVNGICLTVVALEPRRAFRAIAGLETVEKTTLGSWLPGRKLNLELALRLSDRLGGHLVQGHVDGVVTLLSMEQRQETRVLWLELPRAHSRYVVQKGSVAIDGVSLTVNEIRPGRFRLNVIPHTWAATSLVELKPGSMVNLEVDVLARYVEKLLGGDVLGEPGASSLGLDRLRENGFL